MRTNYQTAAEHVYNMNSDQLLRMLSKVAYELKITLPDAVGDRFEEQLSAIFDELVPEITVDLARHREDCNDPEIKAATKAECLQDGRA